MLTNNEIVTYVKYNMNVKGMIEKNIKQSVMDDSCSDLEQYIYEILLNKTNQYLNKLNSENKLALPIPVELLLHHIFSFQLHLPEHNEFFYIFLSSI